MNSDLQALDNLDVDNSWLERWPAGEQLAQQQLQRFVHEAIRDYKQTRDFPAQDNTSRLSAYQAVGALSTMQCLRAALAENNGELDSGNEGIVTWINELIWRDFYRHLLVAYPDLCKHKAFKSDTDRLPWKHDEDKFQRWCEGNTGYPIVDAAMRQMNQTGWMHNRLRMIVAMFLTKHLFIDWRWGERYFMQKLVDGDLASNNGGWQWSASTGCDAVPYFRIFNPVTQSERFDPKGDFIRNYVPEIAKFDAKKFICRRPTWQNVLVTPHLWWITPVPLRKPKPGLRNSTPRNRSNACPRR
ncbi:cryptochrome/photolyase family protein [Pseudobowmanella zhangzhouensis]|uniref:cryptochrome/photolyase family protein n=1 Tax=Pseudobowmanella zhangzhouensis TaxID=1537679 RepID=UPI00360BF75B